VLDLGGHTADVQGVMFSCDGWLIALPHSDGVIAIWGREGVLAEQLPTHPPGRLSAAFSPTNNLLATVDEMGQVRVWDVVPSRLVHTFHAVPTDELPAAATAHMHYVRYAPDGLHLAVDCPTSKGAVQLWRLAPSHDAVEWVGAVGATRGAVYDMEYSPDGRLLALTVDRQVQLYDMATLAPTSAFVIPEDVPYTLAFSPDGRFLAVGGARGNVWMWEGAQRRLISWFTAHSETLSWAITSMDWSPTGALLATAGWNFIETYRTKHNRSKDKNIQGRSEFPIKLWEIALEENT
jgi:WD40 repeat protein